MSIIKVQEASKIFRPLQGKRLLRDQVRGVVSRNRKDGFYALNKVSFSVEHGESVALVGTNGAGKSTMLAMLCGLARPDEGTVEVEGPVAALLELASGFHPDLTGRENVLLNAAYLGLSRQEALARMDAIVEFAELSEFIDQLLRTYSTGMVMRLGFSVAVHSNPELVIVDEVLSVGDGAFQAKCLERIGEIRARGKALLLVSHNATMVRELCDRAIWLHKGELIMDGPADETLAAYANYLHDPSVAPVARQLVEEKAEGRLASADGAGPAARKRR
jgi:ABC-type polysaccharide/polyol phosphate transport system ATPase subunit